MVFPCSKILYLFCFKSLGLDITSVFLNPFKMAATYLFLWFPFIKESCGRLIPSDTLCIEKVCSIPSTKCPFELETWILSISISKIYLRSCSIYWLALTLDPCPDKWILLSFLLELHHALFTLPNKKRGSCGTEQMMSSEEHLHSYIKWWM